MNLFNGRINRVSWLVGTTIIGAFYLFAFLFIRGAAADSFISFFRIALFLLVIIFGFSLQIRRLHDIGASWILVLVLFIPIINILFFLYLLFAPGEDKDNPYGKQPRQGIHF